MLERVTDVFVDVVADYFEVQLRLALTVRARHLFYYDSTSRLEQVAVTVFAGDVHYRTTLYVV